MEEFVGIHLTAERAELQSCIEIGIDRFLFNGTSSPSGAGTNPVPDLLEEVEVAEHAGIAIFSLGEHHTAEFADSSPAVLLAAAAARTRSIRLDSAITILRRSRSRSHH